MVQEKTTSFRKGISLTLGVFGIFAVMIGCGGGGGGTSTGIGSTSTATATATSTSSTSTAGTATSTATTSTATTSTSTSTSSATTSTATTSTATTSTATTSTSSTGGTITGILAPNELIYNSSSSTTTNVDTIAPDGTGDTLYTSYDSQTMISTPNPQQAGFAFAYSSSTTSPSYEIYTNTTVSPTGATQITSLGLSGVYSLQYSPDGTKIIFVATVGNSSTSSLYVMNKDGSNMRILDSADDAYMAGNNTTIAYTKVDTSGNGQIYTVNFDGSGLRTITNDAFDHFGPQYSKDSTRLTWAADANGTSYDIFQALPDGSQLTQLTNISPDNAVTPTFGPDGTQVGFIYIASTDTSKTGLYTIGINAVGLTPVVIRSDIGEGLYWTSNTGILSTGKKATVELSRSYHIIRLKKLGRWHH